MPKPADEQDERLLVAEAQRDPRRFGELYDRHLERVYAYVARRVPDRGVAEDLTSEAFRRALEHLPRYQWRGVPFAAWLLRIAGNVVRDHLRRAGRELGHTAAEPSVDPDQDWESTERLIRVFRMVDELPGLQRRVLLMRFVQELSIREIAQEIDRSEGAVKQLQFRALQALRHRVSESDD